MKRKTTQLQVFQEKWKGETNSGLMEQEFNGLWGRNGKNKDNGFQVEAVEALEG